MTNKETKTSASTTKKAKKKQIGFFIPKYNKHVFAENLEQATIKASGIET